MAGVRVCDDGTDADGAVATGAAADVDVEGPRKQRGPRHVRRRGVTRVIPVVHRSGLPVDVVLAGPGLEEEMFARERLRKIGRMEIPFIETGDLVVLKVLAGRPKDLEDVRALLRLHPSDLDVAVARERLGRLAEVLEDEGLLATLDRMASEASPSPTTKRRAARPSPTWT